MSEKFPKINVKFHSNVITHNWLMNRFSYYITTNFIPSNKYYNSCRNPHSVYQMYPKSTLHYYFFFLVWTIEHNVCTVKLSQKKKDNI